MEFMDLMMFIKGDTSFNSMLQNCIPWPKPNSLAQEEVSGGKPTMREESFLYDR